MESSSSSVLVNKGTATTTANNNNNNLLYITIGPQCCGKTTYLKSQKEYKNIVDISIDDQNGVYMPIHSRYYLECPLNNNNNNDRNKMKTNNKREDEQFLNRNIISKTIGYRISEQEELCAILQRIDGKLSTDEFRSIMNRIYHNFAKNNLSRRNNNNRGNGKATMNNNNTITSDMIQADYHSRIVEIVVDLVEKEFVTNGRTIPNTIDLFCVEALFRPHPKTNLTAVDVATQKLNQAAKTTLYSNPVVAWGNTNAKARDYKSALSAASASNRQVYFILPKHNNIINDDDYSLPVLDFMELYRRNLNRLLETGKFVPAKAIWDTSQRLDTFLNTTIIQDLEKQNQNNMESKSITDDEKKNLQYSKLDFDKALARMANFEMKDDRTVKYVPPPGKKANTQTNHQRKRNAK
eukprot:CAMPEP_0194175646 /NCGR_PEP_ID=MMETSP0154-20130528/9650_1 /TAXON_ID=1049557 /ORGANISM="Thalassiothrix antarctica, Strain L6-D1" /LENGTH=408 /DNA_ID=CAMNT_0038889523 /DNA_START=48 /DNA_END=1271 /DNA_ORIENTATION=-